MQILVVNFNLTGMSHSEFLGACDELAPAYAEVPGLISKVWLSDPQTNTYGGVYTFRDRAALDAFRQSELYAQVGIHPNFANIRAAAFDVLEQPTRITRGLMAAHI